MSGKLKFDPLSLPDRSKLSPQEGEFFKWFTHVRRHHEFPALEGRLSRVSSKFGETQWDFECNLFWQAWRAATWRPDAKWDVVFGENPNVDTSNLLAPFQHGPAFFPKGLRAKTRLPSAATMLAAQIVNVCKVERVAIDWHMLAHLIAVAGVDQVAPESLRVAAGRLMKEIDKKLVVLIAWPCDSGATLQSLESLLARYRQR